MCGIVNSDKQPKLSLILGIRPDVIRASELIGILRSELGGSFEFVWSGQHYSKNMKDIFFDELSLPAPDVNLNTDTTNDGAFLASVQRELFNYFEESRPKAAVFLGDTNTVMGSVAAAATNTPIVHIEGCMRSYDWRMPEEKYRTTIDHLSDRIYAYLDVYKRQGIAEGIRDDLIMVTGNPIVDIIKNRFVDGDLSMNPTEFERFTGELGISGGEPYVLMTIHRRENVDTRQSLKNILALASHAGEKVIFFAGYRTQARIRELGLRVPSNVLLFDPTGYRGFLNLLNSATFAITDSGTVVEEAAILGVPSVQARLSTERPQVYDWGASVKFDPTLKENRFENSQKEVILEVKKLAEKSWTHAFGDGNTSRRIADDLLRLFYSEGFSSRGDIRELNEFSRNAYK